MHVHAHRARVGDLRAELARPLQRDSHLRRAVLVHPASKPVDYPTDYLPCFDHRFNAGQVAGTAVVASVRIEVHKRSEIDIFSSWVLLQHHVRDHLLELRVRRHCFLRRYVERGAAVRGQLSDPFAQRLQAVERVRRSTVKLSLKSSQGHRVRCHQVLTDSGDVLRHVSHLKERMRARQHGVIEDVDHFRPVVLPSDESFFQQSRDGAQSVHDAQDLQCIELVTDGHTTSTTTTTTRRPSE